MNDLVGLNEYRRDASTKNVRLQSQVKYLYHKKVLDRKFELDEMVLMWNARIEDKGKHGNFDPI